MSKLKELAEKAFTSEAQRAYAAEVEAEIESIKAKLVAPKGYALKYVAKPAPKPEPKPEEKPKE